jgi:hypothetical protein
MQAVDSNGDGERGYEVLKLQFRMITESIFNSVSPTLTNRVRFAAQVASLLEPTSGGVSVGAFFSPSEVSRAALQAAGEHS